MTAAELQAAIDAGIIKVINSGQEYQLPDGTRVRRPEIASLRELRDQVKAEAEAESDGMPYFQGPLGLGRPS